MIHCIAIDDEPLALELIGDMLKRIPFIELKGTFSSVKSAEVFLQKNDIDLLFLDIQMPGITGIEFAKKLDESKMVIFTTAFDQYAVEGFNIDAVDYILKPIDKNRLSVACEKAFQLYKWKNLPGKEDFIFVPSQHKMVKIYFHEIIYVEGLKDYVKIHLEKKEKPLLTRTNLKGMEKLLANSRFKRVHKSYLVNTGKISSINGDELFLGNVTVPIGSNYKQELKDIYK